MQRDRHPDKKTKRQRDIKRDRYRRNGKKRAKNKESREGPEIGIYRKRFGNRKQGSMVHGD